MPEGFQSIKEILQKEPGLKQIRQIISDNDVVNDFDKIFPEFKKIVKATKIYKGCLTLKAENPAWRSELKFKETEIIKKINAFYNEQRINKIKFSAR